MSRMQQIAARIRDSLNNDDGGGTTTMQGLGDVFQDAQMVDIYPDGADVFSTGGASAGMRADYEAKLLYSEQLRWTLIRAIEKIKGKPLDYNNLWPRGANYGSFYDGMLTFQDGEVL